MNIGHFIKDARKLKELTQKQLGEKINKKEITIRKYESGDIIPNMAVLKEIANALDINLSDLLGLNKDEMLKNFKEISNTKTVDLEIGTLNHVEEILKISESIGYENCLKYFNLLTLEEKLYFIQNLRNFMSKELKTIIYANHKYDKLSSNEQSTFGLLDSETIDAIKQKITSK